MRPTSCRARDSGYRSALLNTLARGARHLDGDRRQGARRAQARHRLVRRRRRRPAGAGRRAARRARRGGARPRAGRRPSSTTAGWSAARRSSRCCWSTASACCAPAITPPSRRFRKASRRRRRLARRASWRHAGRRRAVELAGLRPRRAGAADRADRRLRHARPPAPPGARLGLSAHVGARARSSCSTPRRRRRRKWRRRARPRPWRSKCPTAAQRLVVNCGGPGPLPSDLSARAGRGPAHDRGAQHVDACRHQFDQHPARWLARQRRRGRRHRPQRGQ